MGEMEKKWGRWILIAGGLNWGLAGFGRFFDTNLNIINIILGSVPAVENLVYVIIGICAAGVGYMELAKSEKK